MHHRIRLEGTQSRFDRLVIADVGLQEPVSRVMLHRIQRLQVGGIGETVDVEHRDAQVLDEVAAQSRPDETGAARYEDPHDASPALWGAAAPASS